LFDENGFVLVADKRVAGWAAGLLLWNLKSWSISKIILDRQLKS
jgi:hypothetical protein